MTAASSARRLHSLDTKLALVREVEAGASVASVSEAHGIAQSMVYHWLRQYRDGQLTDQPADHPTIRAATKRGGRARKKRKPAREPAGRAAESLSSEKPRQTAIRTAEKPDTRAAGSPGVQVAELLTRLAERDAKIRELQRVVRALRAALDAVLSE